MKEDQLQKEGGLDTYRRFASALCAAAMWFAGVVLSVGYVEFAHAQAANTIEVDLPAQPLEAALRSLITKEGIQILFTRDDVKSITTPEVKGRFTPLQAIEQLIRGSGLTVTTNGSGSFAIKPTRSQPATKVETITVTGTNIRGAATASPLQVHTREEIERTGVATVQQFIQRLPQNFNGGASEHTIGGITGGGNTGAFVGGTGVNLRGLGSDATLVLINGRRVAHANTEPNFVDISLIPLSAVDRVEIVMDGASAIYGADAVGGVVNFILRREYEGADTRLRYGTVTEGSSHESQLGQTLGIQWVGGSGLLSYEFYERTALSAADRAYTRSALLPYSLLPEQERNSLLLTLEHSLRPGLNVFADGMYSKRSFVQDSSTASFSFHSPADIELYGAALGGRATLGSDLEGELSASYSGGDTRRKLFNLRGGALATNDRATTSILSADAKLQGSLWKGSGAGVLFAVGAQVRKESLIRENLRSGHMFEPERDVTAGYAEVRVPILMSADAPTTKSLELTFAGRAERYSDFGSTSNPKAGLVWSPNADLRIRGTYGTSFKAPHLKDLDPVPSQVAAFRVFDPSVGREVNALAIFGGNRDLVAEKAKTLTIGFDWSRKAESAWRISGSYYDTRFTDRINNPRGLEVSPLDFLRFESLLGPSIVLRNPSPAVVQGFISGPNFVDFTGPNFGSAPGGLDPSSIAAIADNRQQNLSRVETSGIDFGLSYSLDHRWGSLEVGLDGTYILKYDTQFSAVTPVVELLNSPYNPIDLKARARAVLRSGNWTFGGFVNYVDSYTDKRREIVRSVKSWTTADAILSYQFSRSAGLLSGLVATVSVLNVTDEDPPFVATASVALPAHSAINFDGANANVLGRFVSVQLTKQW
jgi:iron complex outermembrane recepter protein